MPILKEKVAIYCRLSVEDKGAMESESIRNQKSLLEAYARNQNWEIYKIYTDEDYSGLREDRPDFLEMIGQAKVGAFQIILAKTQSRFSRSATTTEKYLHELFPLWGIRFVTVVDSIDTAKKENKKSQQINSLVNEWYCEELSENIRLIFRRKMEEGQFLGNYAPYGYQKNPQDSHKLVVFLEEARIVKFIGDAYRKGKSFQSIATMLNEHKILTPTMSKQLRGQDMGRKSSGIWGSSTIGKILSNSVYIGYMVQGKEKKISFKSKQSVAIPKKDWIIVKDTHEPIFRESEFIEIQKIREKKQKKSNV